MSYDNNKPFVAKSVDQLTKEYKETPFWLGKFWPGSRFTIVEDHLRSKPLRSHLSPSNYGGKPYNKYLIKISDGFIEKDLELKTTEAQLLFLNLPETVKNLKGVTLANDNGRWIYIAQDDPTTNENFPKSEKIAASMEEAPTEIGGQIRALHAAMQTNQATKITNSFKVVLDIAEKTRPGDALALITEAKKQGWITERVVDGVTTYRAE